MRRMTKGYIENHLWNHPTWKLAQYSLARHGFVQKMKGQPRQSSEELMIAWEEYVTTECEPIGGVEKTEVQHA